MLATDEMVAEAMLDVSAALGKAPADLVLRDCHLVNVCSEEIHRATIAIRGSRIVAIRHDYTGPALEERDCSGLYAMPGVIEPYFDPSDARSSAETLLLHGVTSVVAARGADLGRLASAGIRCLEIGADALPIQPAKICSNSDEALEWLRQGTTIVLDCGSDPVAWQQTFAELKFRNIDHGRFLLRHVAGKTFMPGEGPLGAAVAAGIAPARALQMATFNPAIHFALDHEVGSISPGRFADIVLARQPCGVPELAVLNGGLVSLPSV